MRILGGGTLHAAGIMMNQCNNYFSFSLLALCLLYGAFKVTFYKKIVPQNTLHIMIKLTRIRIPSCTKYSISNNLCYKKKSTML